MSFARFAAALSLLALIPIAAEAQTTITACYVPKTGSVYRIKAPDSPQNCKSGHVEFSWKAPQVTYGTISAVTANFTIQPGTQGGGTAECPAGSVAISGGYIPATVAGFSANFQIRMNANHPQVPGWRVSGHNFGTTPVEIAVQAYCAPVSQ